MKKYLLPEKGHFYKANLHCHTNISDGKYTPEEIKEVYKNRGYHIVAYTDHNIYNYHKELNDDDFVALAAYEIDINEKREDKLWRKTYCYHINLYDENPEIKKEILLPDRYGYDINYVNSFIKQAADNGFLACYNHPYWSLHTFDDYKDIKGCFAMEIYNYGCVHDGLYGYNPQAYDEMLRSGNRLFCLATDDNHNSYPLDHPFSDSFGGFAMIKAEILSYANIISALKKGEFYSSMGPLIHSICLDGNILTIECSEVDKIFVITDGRNCYMKTALNGESITKAEFELSMKDEYIRIDCCDKNGRHALSNAYFLEA